MPRTTLRLAAATFVASLTAAAGAAPIPGSSGPLSLQAPETVYQVRLRAEYDGLGRIEGHEELSWRNTSSVPVGELRFHLYLNAFANNRSTFMEESGGSLRGDRFDRERWGWIDVTAFRLADGTDLAGEERFVSPDDGNPFDRTVAVYPLPEPVPPGGLIRVDLDFTAELPSIFARTGVAGPYVLAGQWFPKIAVFEDAGVRGRREPGWNCHQFHAWSEFYADFGDYDVTLTLPERYAGKIGATGRKVEEERADGKIHVRFVQRGVHDFAWVADPRFEVVRDRFDPARDVPANLLQRTAAELGRPAAALTLPPVGITLLVEPSHAWQAGRYLAAAKAAIRGYGLRLGAYPYSTLTMVDPPDGAEGSGGMEYPTFITLGTHPLISIPPFSGLLLPEVVTVHEFGHQYFYGMLASNEFEESWLDEGINSYYEMVVMDGEYGGVAHLPGLRLTAFESNRLALPGLGRYTDPVDEPAWWFLNVRSYALNSYMRPALTLEQLRRLLGGSAFDLAMRRYFERYRFRHPTTADFERTLETASGRDLAWFFGQALHSTRHLDYAVRSLRNQRIEPEEGFFGRGDRRERRKGEGETGEWKASVVVVRNGDFQSPVEVAFHFADGRQLRRSWAGDRRWVRWTFTGPSRLTEAVVDPDGVLVLDVDRLNNGRRAEPDPRPAARLLTDLLFWLQSFFAGASLLS